MRFTKMHGIGNDYIYINGLEQPVPDPAALSVRMSRAHFGCGSDGLILILPSDRADFRMRMFNADGSESGMCGNGIRCVARYCHDRGLTDKTDLTVETGAGIKRLLLTLDAQGQTQSVRVDMGAPRLDGPGIPSTLSQTPVLGHPVTVDGATYALTLVNMGNPHAVTFVPDPDAAPVTTHGPLLENHALFPSRANVEFVQVVDRGHLRMRVWERGTGETLACGTGACAALVAGVLNGLCEHEAVVSLRGGDLQVAWAGGQTSVFMSGPATFVYDGEWLAD